MSSASSQRMDLQESTTTKHTLPIIFPRNSVNILTGPTNVGKTFYITQLVKHHSFYFQTAIDRILIVLCNERVQPTDLEIDITTEHLYLSDFNEEQLRENDLVIIDDLQTVTDHIRSLISVCAHHYNLASLFVITHSLLGSQNFELLNICHRVFLFTRAASNTRLSHYIIDHFEHDPETKAYLKTVLSFCARQEDVLVLELNPIGQQKNPWIALSHLLSLPTAHFAFAYQGVFPSMSVDTPNKTRVELGADSTYPFDQELPKNTLVLVPAESVTRITDNDLAQEQEDESSECADKTLWDQTLLEIEDNIEDFFPSHRWRICKTLAKEVLKTPNVCVTTNGRYIHIIDKPNTKANLLSFLNLATRRTAPKEQVKGKEWSVYATHVTNLLKHDTPRELFVNKLLLVKRK